MRVRANIAGHHQLPASIKDCILWVGASQQALFRNSLNEPILQAQGLSLHDFSILPPADNFPVGYQHILSFLLVFPIGKCFIR